MNSRVHSGEDESTYVYCKGYFAMNTQAIGDRNMMIRH